MIARAMQPKSTVDDVAVPEKTQEEQAPSNGEVISVPDPAKNPEWSGISNELAKDFGTADPSSPMTKGQLRSSGIVQVDEPPIGLKVALSAAPPLPESADPNAQLIDAPNGALVEQITELQAQLKQERAERLGVEATVKELTLENREVREKLVVETVSAATSRAALEAREELLAHLKDEVSELRAMFTASRAAAK
mmetsp:Transcript_32265/g.69351  ORF Transcript_32265/g.69351 Transcript_32265/m.69351 type:complete len:195 (-) Transcript_32265:9-593(-)